MSSNCINVDLYGGKGLFGGKEMPLEADEIYCDKYAELPAPVAPCQRGYANATVYYGRCS